MKKRILGLALVVGMLLSLCASAWAYRYEFTVCEAEYSAIHRISTRSVKNLNITIALRAGGYADDDPTAEKSGLPIATELRVSLGGTTACLTGGALSQTSYSLTGANLSTEDTLSGTVSGTAGTITVTAQLYNNNTAVGTAKTTSIVFDNNDADDTPNAKYPTGDSGGSGPYGGTKVYDDDDTNDLAGTAADPDSENWNGIDPTFGTSGGNNKDKPKIATSKPSFTVAGASAKALTSGTADTFTVEIQGPLISKTSPDTGYDLSQPHALIDVYVAAKDAIKLGWLEKGATTNIQLNSKDIKSYAIPFRVTSWDVKSGGTDKKPLEITTLTIAYNGAHVAYKGFPLTVSAANDKTGTKPVSKTYKIDIASSRSTPQWVDAQGYAGDAYDKEAEENGVWTKKNTAEVVVNFSSSESTSTTFTLSGDTPYTITTKDPKSDSGISVNVTQPKVNKWGEVTNPGYVTVSGSFAQTDKNAGKEQKANVTMTAAGSVKKASAKATVIGKVAPYFDTKKITTISKDGVEYDYLASVKRVEAGKVPSVKFAAKGSKTITYSIDDDSLAALNAVGLSFDTKKGAVIALGDKKNIKPTLNEAETAFQSIDIEVTATNEAGTATLYAEVGVTGAKPKFKTKTITLSRDEIEELENETELSDFDGIELSNASGDHLIYTLADDKSATALSNIGLSLNSTGYLAIADKTKIKATKGTKISVNADNYGAVAKGSINVVVVDPAPEITGDSTLALTAAAKSTTGSLTLKLAENPTDGAKTKWTLSTKPASDWGASLKAASDGNTATLSVKLKKDIAAGSTATAKVVAQNQNSKLSSKEFTVTLSVPAATTPTSGDSTNGAALKAAVIDEAASAPEAEAEAEEEAAEEAKLTFGAPRTAANLTATQSAFLQSKGYTVIAVLPEVTSDKDDQAEIPVELIEDAPEGAKLVYIPFPKNAAETEDDKIADFYDEDGADIKTVPAAKNITVAPWFRAGVTYEPVIAAEK